MAKVEFTRVETNDNVENIDIKDGRFIVTGEGKAFVDYGENRISIGGTPDTQMSDSSTNSVENRVIKGYVDNVADSIPELSNVYGTSNENGYTQEYINNSLEWKLINTVTGNTRIELPNTWNEILITSSVTGDNYKGLTCIIPFGAPNNMNYRLSYYGSTSDNANVGYYYGSANDIRLSWYNVNGSSIDTSTVQTKVFYR